MADNNNEEKIKFFDGVKGEFHKITWPDQKSLTRQTVAVALICLVTGAFIAVIDFAVQYGVDFLVK